MTYFDFEDVDDVDALCCRLLAFCYSLTLIP